MFQTTAQEIKPLLLQIILLKYERVCCYVDDSVMMKGKWKGLPCGINKVSHYCK